VKFTFWFFLTGRKFWPQPAKNNFGNTGTDSNQTAIRQATGRTDGQHRRTATGQDRGHNPARQAIQMRWTGIVARQTGKQSNMS
jgi:hypothetical protein